MDSILTTAEAAEELGVTPNHVRLLCKRGTLKAVRKGHDWWIDRAAVEDYKVADRKRGPKPKVATE